MRACGLGCNVVMWGVGLDSWLSEMRGCGGDVMGGVVWLPGYLNEGVWWGCNVGGWSDLLAI